MTVAICLRCGAQKVGAMTPCPSCRYDPATESDRRTQAKSLWLSDQYVEEKDLAVLGARLKASQPVLFDEGVIDGLVTQLRTQTIAAVTLSEAPAGCSVVVWALVALLVGLLGLVLFLVTR